MFDTGSLLDSSFVLPEWPALRNVVAYTTTRIGGVSCAPFDCLNIAKHVADDVRAVEINRSLLPNQAHFFWLKQTHSTHCINLANVNNTNNDQVEADACFSTLKNQVCAVMTADCLPILVCDTDATIVAAIHAGWRGLADGVVEKSINKLQVNPINLMAWMGPAISQPYFEVGQDVKDLFSDYPAAFRRNNSTNEKKYFVDLYQIAKQKMLNLGLKNVYGGDRCTYSEDEYFFSHRRATHKGLIPGFQHITTGRMVSAIYLK
ncbi:peptidoglycan editing factor PgeF [Paraglaciecola sp.]|uniref:peptidoglycan editing factor PgeF n=1 Tax=Paraglaciecola sp. TaxID=1920173 RepID=UPI003EF372DA